MEYNLDKEDRGLAKGPFWGAAGFIFFVLALFASISLQEQGTLGHWQIATCLLGTGLIATLLFLPLFLQGILDRIEDLLSNNDSDSISKAIFELKEIRSELNALALKTDKVPTLVDKIVSESIEKDSDDFSESEIIEKLRNLELKIFQKLDQIEQSNLSTDLLTESEPSQDALKESIEKLSEQVRLLHQKIDLFQESSPTSQSFQSAPKNDKEPLNESAGNISETLDSQDSIEDEHPFVSENEKKAIDDELKGNQEYDLEDNNDSFEDSEEPDEELEDLIEENETIETSSISVEDEARESKDSEELISAKTKTEESPDPEIIKPEKIGDDVAQELDLGLPSPQETLRKVDALLSGEDKPQVSQSIKDSPKTGDKNGTTTVVANVMIGIGNKPYLRGEGPGLSWDEGVSMNFIEIGKWAWSPPRKNASLTVQIYRNDQDPDKGGKVQVEPGQKLEITPDFS